MFATVKRGFSVCLTTSLLFEAEHFIAVFVVVFVGGGGKEVVGNILIHAYW